MILSVSYSSSCVSMNGYKPTAAAGPLVEDFLLCMFSVLPLLHLLFAEVTPLRCREMVLGDSHNEHDRVHSINLRPGAF